MSKTCPYCREEIDAQATRCKHCRSDLPPEPSSLKRAIFAKTAAVTAPYTLCIFLDFAQNPLAGRLASEEPRKFPYFFKLRQCPKFLVFASG